MASFATLEDLQAFWRTITPEETSRANLLLEMASDRLRLMAKNSGIDLDALILTDTALAGGLRAVVLSAVQRSLVSNNVNMPAVESYQQTAGPYSENIKYANPTGDLYFTKAELGLIGLGGKQKLSSIITTREDLYNVTESI